MFLLDEEENNIYWESYKLYAKHQDLNCAIVLKAEVEMFW